MLQDTTILTDPATVPTLRDTLGPLLTALLPWLQGRLSVPMVEFLKTTFQWVNSRAGWQKQILVLTINGALAGIGILLGVEIPGLDAITTGTVSAVLASAVAMAVHASQTSKENKTAIAALNAKQP